MVLWREGLEPRAREWYGDVVADMTPEELARMLLRDGCYLLGRLGNHPDPRQPQPGNFGNMELRDVLYLIDNQLPFFVLEEINERPSVQYSSLRNYLANYVRNVLVAQRYISPGRQRTMEQPCHLLHLVHTYFHQNNFHLQPCTDLQPLRRTGRWRRATEYRMHANVRFRPRDFSPDVTCILDVRLEGSTLWIPRLLVGTDTWTLLRNLIMLEQQIPRRPVTAYCIFMAQVACTVEDMRLLVDAKIVQLFHVSEEIAAQHFADLCNGVVMNVENIDSNYLKPI